MVELAGLKAFYGRFLIAFVAAMGILAGAALGYRFGTITARKRVTESV